jgi:hypothetical protein
MAEADHPYEPIASQGDGREEICDGGFQGRRKVPVYFPEKACMKSRIMVSTPE